MTFYTITDRVEEDMQWLNDTKEFPLVLFQMLGGPMDYELHLSRLRNRNHKRLQS